jgi:hypothetical protein
VQFNTPGGCGRGACVSFRNHHITDGGDGDGTATLAANGFFAHIPGRFNHAFRCQSRIWMPITRLDANHACGCQSRVLLPITHVDANHAFCCQSRIWMPITRFVANHAFGCQSRVLLPITHVDANHAFCCQLLLALCLYYQILYQIHCLYYQILTLSFCLTHTY